MADPAPDTASTAGRIGVLLINLGTPDAPTPAAVRRYLRQFLSDRRVIETSPLVWQPILNLFVLPFRPRKTAEAYRLVWRDDADGSPLRHFTRRQAEAAADGIGRSRNDVTVEWAMRYGSPSVADRLGALRAQGCDRILALALYPQYSATTTATAYDEVFRALQTMRWQPALRTAPAFAGEPAYIDALAASVREHLAGLDWTPDAVIASYHGLPRRYVDAGDPYLRDCEETTRRLRERLGWDDRRLMMTFQSRFGALEWLKPYTDETLAALPRQGVRRVAVMAPSFLADCLETLEELAEQGRHTFLEAGGEGFSFIPCLNDAPQAVGLLLGLIRRELAGWL
jgi:ferrochelatase